MTNCKTQKSGCLKDSAALISEKEFQVLRALISEKELLSQRKLQEKCGLTLGSLNRALKTLAEKDMVKSGKITTKGKAALKPYEVKRAIFIAAGFGSRMVPVTLNTPKPLVRVNGTRIIDTAIDACLRAGIKDIYIVRGYLGEQFDSLLYKYPKLHFIQNDMYNEANNISSAFLARKLLKNAYVFEADLYVKNPDVVQKYHYTSDFLGFYMKRSDDWAFEVKNGIIKKLFHGGSDCYQEVGISYWDAEDGKKLEKDIAEVFDMPGGKENFWEAVPLAVCNSRYHVRIHACQPGDVIEIDSFKELTQIDSSYKVK